VNLSPGGVCLHLPRPLAVGETVELAFDLPPAGGPVCARGRVIWCEAPGAGGRFHEAGVRFEELGAAERAAIRRFVRDGDGEGADADGR
jgi:hypothetical protein